MFQKSKLNSNGGVFSKFKKKNLHLMAASLSEVEVRSRVHVNQRNLVEKLLARYDFEETSLRELIQNADDAGASRVLIDMMGVESVGSGCKVKVSGSLLLSNNGKPFSDVDFKRIASVADGNQCSEAVGQFGVGFFSVFGLSEAPCIQSSGTVLRFAYSDSGRGDELETFCRRASKKLDAPWTTRIDLPLKEPLSLNLSVLGDFLMFAKQLRRIDVAIDGRVQTALGASIRFDKATTTYRHRSQSSSSSSSSMSTNLFRIESIECVPCVVADRRRCTMARANVRARFGKSFGDACQRAIKKALPERFAVRLMVGVDDGGGAQMGRVFVGSGPLGQTTGCRALDIEAPLFTTMERNRIDLHHASLRVWNSETLEVCGAALRHLYDSTTRAKLSLCERLGFVATTPADAVGQLIERGFFSGAPICVPTSGGADALAPMSAVLLPRDNDHNLMALLLELGVGDGDDSIAIVDGALYARAGAFFQACRRHSLLTDDDDDAPPDSVGVLVSACAALMKRAAADVDDPDRLRRRAIEWLLDVRGGGASPPLMSAKQFGALTRALRLDKVKYFGAGDATEFGSVPIDARTMLRCDDGRLARVYSMRRLDVAAYAQWLTTSIDGAVSGSRRRASAIVALLSRNASAIDAQLAKTAKQRYMAALRKARWVPVHTGRLVAPPGAHLPLANEQPERGGEHAIVALPTLCAQTRRFLKSIGVRAHVPVSSLLGDANKLARMDTEQLVDYLAALTLSRAELAELSAMPLIECRDGGRVAPRHAYFDTEWTRRCAFALGAAIDSVLCAWQPDDRRSRAHKMMRKLGVAEHVRAAELLRCVDASAGAQCRALRHFFAAFNEHYGDALPLAELRALEFLAPRNGDGGDALLAAPCQLALEANPFLAQVRDDIVGLAERHGVDLVRQLGVHRRPPASLCIEAIATAPPSSAADARDVFRYCATAFAAQLSPFGALKDVACVPVVGADPPMPPSRVFYRTDDDNDEDESSSSLLSTWLHCADLDVAGDATLRRFAGAIGLRACGSHSALDLAEALLDEATRARNEPHREATIRAYVHIAQQLNAAFSRLPANVKRRLIASDVVLARAADGHCWAPAVDTLLVDNELYAQVCRPALAARADVADFAQRLGVRWLTEQVTERAVATPLPVARRTSSRSAALEQRLRDRAPILLQDNAARPLPGLASGALAKLQQASVVEASRIECSLTFRGVEHRIENSSAFRMCTLAMAPDADSSSSESSLAKRRRRRADAPITLYLLHTADISHFDVAEEISGALFQPKYASAAAGRIAQLLLYSIEQLEARGIAVNRLLALPPPIAADKENVAVDDNNDGERRQRTSSSRRKRREPPATRHFVNDTSAATSLIRKCRSHTAGRVRAHMHVERANDDDDGDDDGDRDACSIPALRVASNVGKVGGFSVFVEDGDRAEHLEATLVAAERADALASFAELVHTLIAPFPRLTKASVSIFVDQFSNTVAFNLNGSVFFNLRCFESQWRSMSRERQLFSWYSTLCHELAHNQHSAHNLLFSRAFESLLSSCYAYFEKALSSLSSSRRPTKSTKSRKEAELIVLSDGD
jgi:Protein of unknown function (DUF3684)